MAILLSGIGMIIALFFAGNDQLHLLETTRRIGADGHSQNKVA